MTLAQHCECTLARTAIGDALDHNFFALSNPDRTYHMRKATHEEIAIMRERNQWTLWAQDAVVFLYFDGTIVHKSAILTDSVIELMNVTNDDVAQSMLVLMIGNDLKTIFGEGYLPH